MGDQQPNLTRLVSLLKEAETLLSSATNNSIRYSIERVWIAIARFQLTYYTCYRLVKKVNYLVYCVKIPRGVVPRVACFVIQCFIIQCFLIQCFIIQCFIIQCFTIQCFIIQCSIIQCSIIQCSIIQACIIQCCIIQHSHRKFMYQNTMF